MISRAAATMAAAISRKGTEHPLTDVADDGGGDL
uniref:Uncharacterized protein n=1 Tax=Arundo donax TaxID=35708 RepID=A0A0A8YFW2_ARUDO